MSTCPRCGTEPVRDGQRFCARCGTDLAGPPAPAPAPPQYAAPPPPAPAGPRRTPVVVLAVAALVAALVGAFGVVLLLDGDEDRASDTTAEDERADEVATSDAVTSPSTTATETETEEQRTFSCWDGGAPVASPSDCDPPSGPEGMAWVFPRSDDTGCATSPGENRATETDCTATVAGAAVRIHYSEWRVRANLESYYGGVAVGAIEPPDGREDLTALQVVSRDSDVGYKVAIYYSSVEGLWSVTVYAADETQYLAALQQVEIRPFDELRGSQG